METERLILRPFEETEEDLALILALYSDPEIMCYVPYDLLNGEQAKAHLKRIAEEWHREKARNCMLLKPWWGAGLAEEMVLAMIDHCFDELHLHRVIGLCHPDNIASWKMMERCGMRREAYCRKNVRYIKNGQERWEDELSYAILWEDRKRDKEDRKWKRQKLHSG